MSSPPLPSVPFVRAKRLSTCEYADPIDPSIDFLYKPHSLLALLAALAALVYYAFVVPESLTSQAGWLAVIAVFLFTSVLTFRDGPFIRPHPAFWRLVTGASVLYLLLLSYALFQDVSWARSRINSFYPDSGLPLPERSYAEDCSLSFKNISSKLDEFVLAHILGWLGKAIIIRNFWLATILSVMFELCEYSLEHHLPNFAECWWDHWILDVLVCNLLGTWLGMRICSYLEMKHYSWRGWSETLGVSAKVFRAAAQFTPHSWLTFEWRATRSLRDYLFVITVLLTFLLCELNAFYLKFVLLVPPSNLLNVYRLVLYFFSAIPATREVYQYVSDPINTRRMGVQTWIVLLTISIETLLCIKYGKGMFPNPFPTSVVLFWSVFAFFFFVLYPVFLFARPISSIWLRKTLFLSFPTDSRTLSPTFNTTVDENDEDKDHIAKFHLTSLKKKN